MVRKITLFFLLMVGLSSALHAQVRDSVSISLPYGKDTTCPGEQLTFTATESNDTFSNVLYHWYTDGTYTGVSVDTFYTTALSDGDSVYCWIVFTNSFGLLDSFKSNSIIVHRSPSFAPRVMIALTVGRNPDCGGHPLTFTAFPVNGGTSPTFQWMVDDTTIIGADSITFTRTFNAHDTISCIMVSNSACAAPYPTTDTSNFIVVSHDSLDARASIVATGNPICLGALDTFSAGITDAGHGASLAWYVNSALIPTALGPTYITDTLHNGDLVYVRLTAPDSCVIDHSSNSNVITMTVISPLTTSAWTVLTEGINPGCLDSPVTFTGHYINFGTTPDYDWYINGVLVAHDTTVFTHTYSNHDTVQFIVHETDNGCYTNDTVGAPSIIMVRDSTPVTPWLSLIGDLLVVNNGGTYVWYYNNVNAHTGSIIPGINTQTYNPHTPGYYYVVKDSAYCQSAPSEIVYISLVGVKIINPSDVNIYPNPSSGQVTIDWGSRVVSNMHMEVCNMLGQVVHREEIKGASRHTSDLSALPDGNYIMVLRDEDGSKSTYKINISK